MICVCLIGTAAIAEETVPRLEPVVVTATKTPKKLENVPAVVTVITSEEIETIPVNPGGQIIQPNNVDEVEIKGVDVELAYDLLKSVTLFANYNYNETRDGKTDDILDGYPRNSALLGFRTRHCFGEDWRLLGSYAARYRGYYTTTSNSLRIFSFKMNHHVLLLSDFTGVQC